MPILPVIKYPAPVLSKKAGPVSEVTPEIASLMDDMAETMLAESGVGLAAPQVGISKRVIVVAAGERTKRIVRLANPEIVSAEGEIEWEEGCLSIPEFRIKIKRKAKIVVRGLSRSGKKIEYLAEGLLAVAFQHEIDHLDGKLLIDNVPKGVREKYLKGCGKL